MAKKNSYSLSFFNTLVKKLKTKLVIKSLFSSLFNFPSISAKILPFLAVFLFAGLLININQAKAAEKIDPNSVQVKTELLINGKADNLLRTYTGGTAQVSVLLTVVQAKNKSAVNLDNIVLGSDLLDFDVSLNFDRTITQFGAGIGKSNNDNCTAATVSAFIGSNKIFAECKFINNGMQFLSAGNVEVGKQYKFDFTLDSAAINNLALTSPCPRNAQTTACFTAWPYLYLSKAGVDRKLAVTGASKDIYVQNFPDKAAMDAAIASNQRPSDVPGYGGNTGGAEIGGGGNRMAALINEILGVLIGFVQELVYGIFYWLIAPMIQAMLSIRVYTDTFVAVIYPGWEVVRNICNIFFIVALMVIALATLFRVDSYQTRPLLIQLILAALMINFSLVIAQAILALADTIQAQFLPANVTVIRSLAGDLMVGNYRSLYITNAFSDASFSGVIKPLFFLAMSIGSFAVFTAIAVFLLIRIVALWLLLLISPIAYAVGVLPSTAQYRGEWWKNFLRYAFFTPIMAFFLNLTAVISNQFKDITILQTVSDPRLVNELGNSDIASFVFKVASNLLLLVFLIAALKVADIAGVYGASGITSIAQKGIFAPFGAVGMGGKALGGLALRTYTKYVSGNILEMSGHGQIAADQAKKARLGKLAAEKNYERTNDQAYLDEAKEWEKRQKHAEEHEKSYALKSAGWRALSFIDPRVVKEAWAKRTHQKDLQAYQPAVGNMVDTFNRVVPAEWLKAQSLKGKKTYYGIIAERGVIDTEAKELLAGIRTREEASRVLAGALAGRDKDEIKAAMKALQANNQQDDFANLEGRTFSVMNYLSEMTHELEKKGFSEEEIVTFFSDLQETGEGQGRLRAYGYVSEDDDGVVRLANDLTYYNKLDKNQQIGEMRRLAGEFDIQAQETKSEEFQAIAEKFVVAADKLERGEFKNFEDAVRSTNYDDVAYLPEAEKRPDMNLGRVVEARRFWNGMNSKVRRGGGGNVARNLEAAVLTDQELDGFFKQNLLGKMMLHRLSPQIISAFVGRIHEGQPRTLLGFGALQDSATGEWALPSNEIASKTDAEIEAAYPEPAEAKIKKKQRDEHKYAWRRLVNTRQMSKRIFDTVAKSDRLFTSSARNSFAKEFNEYIRNSPQYSEWIEGKEGPPGQEKDIVLSEKQTNKSE